MDTHMDLDTDSSVSVSVDILDNMTEVVDPEPSQTFGDVLKNLSNERYELNAFPLDSDHRLKRGTIHSIELHNFKSYFGKVFIDKLSSFNAIIGPNGSGKSNLMDAISFVLCIRTSTLRGSNLRDLINKNPDKSDPIESRYAYVALTLKGDTGFSVFKRAISSKGNISYIYNNNVITFKGYTEALHEYKINTLGSTGLIFQGSVNDIISRSPSELTRLFENISGSSLYEKPYNYIKEKLELVRSDYKNLIAKKKHLSSELKNFRTMESTNRKYQKQLEEYNQTQLDAYKCQFRILANKFHHSSSKYTALMNDYKQLVQKFEGSTKAKNELEERISNLYYHQGKINRTIQHKAQALNEMRNSMNEFFGKRASLESQIENVESTKVNANEDVVSLQKQYEELMKSRSDLLDEIDKIKNDVESAKGDSVELTPSQMNEFNEYLREFKNLTCSINVNVNVLKSSMSQYKSENKQVRSKLKSLESQMDQVDENMKKHNELIDAMGSKMVGYRDELETLHLKLNKMENEKSELLDERRDLTKKRDTYDERIKSLGVLKHEHSYMFKRSLSNGEMCKSVEGVHGEVMSLFEISNKSYFKPVLSAIGSRAHTIVASDYRAISECIQFLKDRKAGRREFLGLDSLNYDKSATRRSISHYLRRVPKLEYVFVIDSIDFDPKFKPLFEYLVGDTLIVPTLDDAERIITAGSQKSGCDKVSSSLASKLTSASSTKSRADTNLYFNVVTQNGQLITRDRTIVIGSTIAANNSEVELEIAQFNKYLNLLNEVEKLLSSSINREKALNDEMQNASTKLEKYKRVMQLTAMKVDFLKKQKDSVRLQQVEISEELSKLTRQSKSFEKSISSLNADLSRENSKLERLKKDHFEPLNRKLGILDVYSLLKNRDEKLDILSNKLAEKRSTLSRYDNDLRELKAKIESTRNKTEQMEFQLVKYKEELEQLKGSNGNVFAEMEALQKEIGEQRLSLNECVSKIEDCNKELSNLHPDYDSYGPDGRVNVMEQISLLKTEMKKIYTEAICLCETCKVKNVPLEMSFSNDAVHSSGSPDGDSGDFEDPGVKSGLFSLDKADDVDYSKLQFPTLVGSSSDAGSDDFLVSPENYETAISDLERQNESYQKELKSLQKLLSSSRSFNNVESRLETTGEELRMVDRELDTLRSQLLKLESDFESIKRERSGLFLHCFHSVRQSVGPIYSRLSSVEGAEGQAFLSLDEVAGLEPEPFHCSIRYNTMPPLKRYLDLNLQSGGEKALSSVALLLALHNYRESPFVVLDEIDANIDSIKLKNLTGFLMESAFQVIIISLKEKLFSNAQRLIGVYRNHPRFTSRCLVLNLEEYEQEAD